MTIGKTNNSNRRQQLIQEIVDTHEQAHHTEHKYRVIRNVIKQLYPILEEIPNDKLENIVFDVVQIDREYRFATETYNQEEKQKLSTNWKENHGY